MHSKHVVFRQVLTGHVGFLSQGGTEGTWRFDIAVNQGGTYQFVGEWYSEAFAREVVGSMGYRKILHRDLDAHHTLSAASTAFVDY